MKRIPCLFYLLMSLTIALAKGASTVDMPQDPLQITLNGLKIAIDRETGGLVCLEYPGPGVLLEAPREEAGLVDVACPIPEFEPLRLATRFSSRVHIEPSPDSVTLTWERLGASRNHNVPGSVSATVRLRAAPDGRSIILTCEIDNRSSLSLPQVIFPDLAGLVAFAGKGSTQWRTAGFVSRPFVDLRVSDTDQFYAVNNSMAEYRAGGLFHPMVARWLDLGSLHGGFSLFPRRWGWEPQGSLFLHLSQKTGRLRLMCAHANVAPFISVLQADKKTAERYGLQVTPGTGNWTYHTELIPRFTPPYASNLACVQAGPSNPKWQEDVPESCKRLVELGIPSISWDQYWSAPQQPDMNSLTAKIRRYARQRDPESTFSGEELWNIEVDSQYLDYTWNWGGYKDYRPLLNAFPAPRVNTNIHASPLEVKLGFADNLYLNVWPSKPDSINGSARIADYPALSQALKQCACLRRQFLPCFTEGVQVGECLLAEECPSARHVNGYVLPDRALLILLNGEKEKAIRFRCDIAPWVSSASGRYTVRAYDGDGKLLWSKRSTGGVFSTRTARLKPLDLAIYEFIAE